MNFRCIESKVNELMTTRKEEFLYHLGSLRLEDIKNEKHDRNKRLRLLLCVLANLDCFDMKLRLRCDNMFHFMFNREEIEIAFDSSTSTVDIASLEEWNRVIEALQKLETRYESDFTFQTSLRSLLEKQMTKEQIQTCQTVDVFSLKTTFEFSRQSQNFIFGDITQQHSNLLDVVFGALYLLKKSDSDKYRNVISCLGYYEYLFLNEAFQTYRNFYKNAISEPSPSYCESFLH